MGFTIGYTRLFTVRIMHGYFLNQGNTDFMTLAESEQLKTELTYNVSDFMHVVPSASTKELMKNRGMVFRMEPKGFLVGIKIDQEAKESGQLKAFIPLEDEVRLRFFIQIKDPYFFNYSNLSLTNSSNKVYRFHNEVDNALNGQAQLSQPVQGYDASRSYEAGNLIVDVPANPTKLFEALRQTGEGPFDAADWEEYFVGEEYQDPPENYSKGDVVRLANSLHEALVNPTTAPPNPAEWNEITISHQYVGEKDLVTLVPEIFFS